MLFRSSTVRQPSWNWSRQWRRLTSDDGMHKLQSRRRPTMVVSWRNWTFRPRAAPLLTINCTFIGRYRINSKNQFPRTNFRKQGLADQFWDLVLVLGSLSADSLQA